MQKKKSLIIVCGGGFAREVIWIARECSREFDIVGIVDDTTDLQGQEICDVPVVGKIADWTNFSSCWFTVAVGAPRSRKAIVSKMMAIGNVRFATLIHPSVLKSTYVNIGAGSIVAAGSILTTQVTLGQHVILNLACTIGHDVIINHYCTLAPQAAVSGNVTLDEGAEIGTGALLMQSVAIGTGSLVSMGSVVTKNVEANMLVAGYPARKAKSMEQEWL